MKKGQTIERGSRRFGLELCSGIQRGNKSPGGIERRGVHQHIAAVPDSGVMLVSHAEDISTPVLTSQGDFVTAWQSDIDAGVGQKTGSAIS